MLTVDSECNKLIIVGPNDLRCIARENAGYYYAVIVGAKYKFKNPRAVQMRDSFYGALHFCIKENPFLSVVVNDMHTDKAFYRHVEEIDLDQHITILTQDEKSIEEVLQSHVDLPFPTGIPPWNIIVLPLEHECFIALSFSHTIGDGITGPSFHRTFLNACNNNSDDMMLTSRVVNIPMRPFPAPFDTPERLPISWSFLLAPFFALFLPAFAIKLLGLRTSASASNEGTWRGDRITYDPETSRSGVKVRKVDAATTRSALRVIRENNTKFTAVFQQAIARALCKVDFDDTVTNFVAQTAINMRGSIGISNSEGGNYASGCYTVYPRKTQSPDFSVEDWALSCSTSERLARSATRLQDQAIGLLRYVPSIKKWTLSKIGQCRDSSFEVSNIGIFDVADSTNATITELVFTQPGSVLSAALAFNVTSVKGGVLTYTVTWRRRGLGRAEDEEDALVEGICQSIEQDLAQLAEH